MIKAQIYNIRNNLIKQIAEEISPTLKETYNDWLNCSYFPDELKIAKMIMIPKILNRLGLVSLEI